MFRDDFSQLSIALYYEALSSFRLTRLDLGSYSIKLMRKQHWPAEIKTEETK